MNVVQMMRMAQWSVSHYRTSVTSELTPILAVLQCPHALLGTAEVPREAHLASLVKRSREVWVAVIPTVQAELLVPTV